MHSTKCKEQAQKPAVKRGQLNDLPPDPHSAISSVISPTLAEANINVKATSLTLTPKIATIGISRIAGSGGQYKKILDRYRS